MLLDGKVALVTGASRGIGRAIAIRLAAEGAKVAINFAGNTEKAEAVKAEIEAAGGEALLVQANVADAAAVEEMVAKVVEAFGGIDVLVNNAGVAPLQRADLLEMTEESFDRVVGINTKGNMFLTQAVARQMICQEPLDGRKGVIINISSCSSVVSSVNRGEYCVSKAGISMLTTLYADRLAPEGILVHEVRPGVIDTDMTSTVHGKYNKLIDEGVFPIARWGKPEDVANAVSALASDKFMYTTGNYIDVDGGFHIRRL